MLSRIQRKPLTKNRLGGGGGGGRPPSGPGPPAPAPMKLTAWPWCGKVASSQVSRETSDVSHLRNSPRVSSRSHLTRLLVVVGGGGGGGIHLGHLTHLSCRTRPRTSGACYVMLSFCGHLRQNLQTSASICGNVPPWPRMVRLPLCWRVRQRLHNSANICDNVPPGRVRREHVM